MATKKEIKEAYKLIKPEMGVFMYKCLANEKVYLGYGNNIKADTNSITFQLNMGSFPVNINLQNDWKKYGASGFEIATIEILGYDKDETKTDYTKDLKLLREFCSEKFSDFEFIGK